VYIRSSYNELLNRFVFLALLCQWSWIWQFVVTLHDEKPIEPSKEEVAISKKQNVNDKQFNISYSQDLNI
jgi:hypothetical protein